MCIRDSLNVNDMFDAALRNTRIEMSPAERRQFYEKHIRHMTLTIDENGNVSIELKREMCIRDRLKRKINDNLAA